MFKKDLSSPLAPNDASEMTMLVVQLQKGDLQVQAKLVDKMQSRLFKFCLFLSHNRELAEDLCQEALIKALQNISHLHKPETFVGWTYQIAKNLFIDHKRSPQNQRFLSPENLQDLGVDSHFELILSVQKTLSSFDPDERFLLLLVELEGCSYKEAAEVLQMTEDAVRSKLHRLRAAFIKLHASDEAA